MSLSPTEVKENAVKLKTTTLMVNPKPMAKLQESARANGTTASALIRGMILNYLRAEARREARQAAKQAAA